MRSRAALALMLAALLALSGCSYILVENRSHAQTMGSARYVTPAPLETDAPSD